jgi:hypothetical protein
LTSWLEEHLAFQQADGSLYDWIDSRGKADKNTTETDQEASAILAAHQVFRILGPVWLRKAIAGRKIIARLDSALEYVTREKRDPVSGLIKGAHTADWGDVDIVDVGQDAVYTDDRTHWTVDIYDQAMFYQAALGLAEMWAAVGWKDRAAAWRNAAAEIQKKTNAKLWQEERGFFAVHRHLDGLTHDFEEDQIFAMGGNAQAALSGLADSRQAQSIIITALERQQAYGVSTLSGTLLPPYPAGTFKHGLLDDPFEYQNGGQWDWFGGRLILAMYENGFSEQATDKLVEVIQKNMANRGFFEWDNREGVGRGSDSFCGSAGILARALVEGYYGVSISQGALVLSPRLGQDSARIHLYIPANNLAIAYAYSYSVDSDEIFFSYNSSHKGPGQISLIIPETHDRERESIADTLTLKTDGRSQQHEIQYLNDDMAVRFKLKPGRHSVKLSFKPKPHGSH